ncbi:hypothetical protein PXD04_05080 [Methanosphaera sp. ISO3-F5]|uniref:hypothetical protein n=1 Tax=Methanosphaera sp. ISO3-F5 TaxID=1452353 RepID=UPI002B25D23F|nr:hypothetical protein [Methanosphaera sp. ISO3-F5]WQH65156.1 hypothetical protein PXD04_05080 [Methanosphaera sp. ISO3-F5]
MKTTHKIMSIIIIGILITLFFISTLYTDTIECDNQTLIISVCTGEMRALETGIAVYAGIEEAPLILSDKTLPDQLNTWLPSYIEKNNITKIIIVGPVTPQQIIEFMKLRVTIKQINGDNIADILTKITENNKNINKNEIIITSSDPLAGILGAYTKTPVFITATNSTYQSANTLSKEYKEYITKHNIKKATIIGNTPQNIKDELKNHNIQIEEISGETSLDVSNNLNNKLKQEGYLKNTNTAFYGFYGEIPTIIPTVIKENAILIEDSSNKGNIIPYLQENNITTVYILRNTESQYIQMEETDYISTDVINNLQNNNITIKYLTKPRTLDEATGLYDMKILTAEHMENTTAPTIKEEKTSHIKTQPPLIAILEKQKIKDSNNITATITKQNNTKYILKWDTIHPYTYNKINENTYHITSNTGYEYIWKKQQNMWKEQYIYNNTTYYNITWTENKDNTWTETHEKQEYTWNFNGQKWVCYNQQQEPIYYIQNIT